MAPYRSDHDALVAQCDSLRSQLAQAAAGSAELEEVRAQLETKLAELEKSRISEAERGLAGKHLKVRGAFLGVGLSVVCAGLIFLYVTNDDDENSASQAQETTWFAKARAHCNPVEVGTYIKRNPAPDGVNGTSYASACLALAGKMPEARDYMATLEPNQRPAAAQVVFNIVHPIADAGDEVAAGPVMEFVLEYTPDNFMAVYHAGMSAHETGRPKLATLHLEHFLTLYPQKDGWRKNALDALKQIAAASPQD